MGMSITRREVLENLIRFKDSLSEMRGNEGRQQDFDQDAKDQKKKHRGRSYKVLLNRRTGDMRFAQKISSLSFPRKPNPFVHPSDWKEIHLIVVDPSPQELVQFEVLDTKDCSLKPSELEPIAWKIASETLHVLNQKAKEIRRVDIGLLPEEQILQDLSFIQLSIHKEPIENFSGWAGSISRLEAEKKLQGKPEGTYLLREGDEITLSIAFQLGETNLLSVHPYLLTVVEKQGKISDLLLLDTDRGWIFYEDDPDLKDQAYPCFAHLSDLLNMLKERARHPFY